jgi:prepilin-type N-terminal cleavage/methylation domain-containing protein/prepilin-type processing-associated H-X9-DG protein
MISPTTSSTRLPPRKRDRVAGRAEAFTLMEILVVVAIIAVLAVLAMPSISRMLVSGQIAKSTSNLKQLSAGVGLYVAENNGNYPLAQAFSASTAPEMTASDRANTAWYEGLGRLLYPEIRKRLPNGVPWTLGDPRNPDGYKGTVFRSPALEPDASIRIASYGYNEVLTARAKPSRRFNLIFKPSTTGLIADNSGKTHSLTPAYATGRLNPRYGASAPHAGDGKATVLFLDGHVEVLDAKTCEEINSKSSHKFWGDKL